MKRTTITEIKKQAKEGKAVSIKMLPSKIKPNTGWVSETVHEIVYENGKFIAYSHNRNIWNDLASTVYWWKTTTLDEKNGKTLKFYEV